MGLGLGQPETPLVRGRAKVRARVGVGIGVGIGARARVGARVGARARAGHPPGEVGQLVRHAVRHHLLGCGLVDREQAEAEGGAKRGGGRGLACDGRAGDEAWLGLGLGLG